MLLKFLLLNVQNIFLSMNQTRDESTVWSGNPMLQALAPNGTVNIVDLSWTIVLNQILMH
jgi:hypothetical protein